VIERPLPKYTAQLLQTIHAGIRHD
jgi:hypothetical protein